jgi:hypothetical protein
MNGMTPYGTEVPFESAVVLWYAQNWTQDRAPPGSVMLIPLGNSIMYTECSCPSHPTLGIGRCPPLIWATISAAICRSDRRLLVMLGVIMNAPA